VVDFLVVLIELFSIAVTAEVRANIEYRSSRAVFLRQLSVLHYYTEKRVVDFLLMLMELFC